MAKTKKKTDLKDGVAATNRKARRDYEIIDTIEAGIVLAGTEVKSIRSGRVSLDECYGQIDQGEAWVHDLQIQPYEFGNIFNHVPKRDRKLLLHKREIEKLKITLATKGLAFVPLKMYFKNGKIKMLMGIGKGKHYEDKRETLKKRTTERDMKRAIANVNRR